MDWLLVPKTPTPQMIQAMIETMPRKKADFQIVSEEVKHRRRWQAALSAAPKPPSGVMRCGCGKAECEKCTWDGI